MKFFLKLTLIIIILIIFILCIVLYFNYRSSSEKIKIEPFGIEMGTRDTSYILNNAYAKKIVSSYAINTPVSKSIYKKLNNSGYCIENYGKKLLDETYKYYLSNIRKPLNLPYPFKDKVTYQIFVHPIIGVYRIVAYINSKKPKEFAGDDARWEIKVQEIIRQKVLPLLRNKYETSFNSILPKDEFEFSSIRIDEKNKNIKIHYKPNYRFENKTGVNIIYNWEYQGYLDKEQTIEWKNFSKCNDEIQFIKKQEKAKIDEENRKRELQKKIEEKNNQNENRNNL